MSNRDLKKFITLSTVRGANTRLMDRSTDGGSLFGTGSSKPKTVAFSSAKIAEAGQVAFSSLKRR